MNRVSQVTHQPLARGRASLQMTVGPIVMVRALISEFGGNAVYARRARQRGNS